jgi:nucleoside-diphosphate-sugar epimerase
MARIAVAGATGRVGRHVVDVLQAGGHDVMAISRSHGVDVITGDALAAAPDHAPTRCRALGGIVAHLDRHFGARAAAERFHLACPLSGDALRTRPWLPSGHRPPHGDDISAAGQSYQKGERS